MTIDAVPVVRFPRPGTEQRRVEWVWGGQAKAIQHKPCEMGTTFVPTLQMWELKVLVTQSCLTLYSPMDCSPPGSSVHGIFQARILEWVAIPFSRGWELRYP